MPSEATAKRGVFATLFCANDGNVPHSRNLKGVQLEVNGDFRIDDRLSPLPPNPCTSPVSSSGSLGPGRGSPPGFPRTERIPHLRLNSVGQQRHFRRLSIPIRKAITYEPGQIVEFHRMPGGPFTTESKKSDLKAASSGRFFAVRRQLLFSEKDGVEKQLPPD